MGSDNADAGPKVCGGASAKPNVDHYLRNVVGLKSDLDATKIFIPYVVFLPALAAPTATDLGLLSTLLILADLSASCNHASPLTT